jgi:hypothetical protein
MIARPWPRYQAAKDKWPEQKGNSNVDFSILAMLAQLQDVAGRTQDAAANYEEVRGPARI